MRELERDQPEPPTAPAPALPEPLAIVGTGRAGSSIARAGRLAGLEVETGSRGFAPADAALVLLCVPDGAIAQACEELAPALAPGALLGHTSGACGLDLLRAASAAGHEVFSLHPLQTIPTPDTDLAEASCAISGSSAHAVGVASALADALGMDPFEVPDDARAAYHAAASMASNFLVSLEESAVELMTASGIENARDLLSPLVLRTAVNWSERGAAALTGPIARGDTGTVELHRRALAERAPTLEPLYEALAERTRDLGARA